MLEEMLTFPAKLALEEVSHWFLCEKQGLNNILACPSLRAGTVPVLALLRNSLESWGQLGAESKVALPV